MHTLLRILGWLLTPLVVGAASVGGVWLGAQLAALFTSALVGAGIAVGLALAAGSSALVWWVYLLRRSARVSVVESLEPIAPKVPVEPSLAQLDEAAD